MIIFEYTSFMYTKVVYLRAFEAHHSTCRCLGRQQQIKLRYAANNGRLQIQTRAARQTFRVARVAFPMAPIVDGERAGRLANMMFGAKHGGHHHQEVRINVVEFTSSDIALQLN